MSSLTAIEKMKLEAFLQMSGGYVLDFTDRTFQAFILDTVGIDIDSIKYKSNGTSKANRLRAFWSTEDDTNVGRLIDSLLDYRVTKSAIIGYSFSESENILFQECDSISTRLRTETAIDLHAFDMETKDKTWKKVREEILSYIQKNEPEFGLDRLHTYLIYFFRDLNKENDLPFSTDTPLNSLAGAYVNYLRQNGFIESRMCQKILNYSIKILEDFNDIRNNKSLSHANPILNHQEAMLIFSNISSLLIFIQSIEQSIDRIPF